MILLLFIQCGVVTPFVYGFLCWVQFCGVVLNVFSSSA